MTRPRADRRERARRWTRARLKAVAGGAAGYLALALAYVLLDDDARATLTAFVPEWARTTTLLLTPIGIAWAVERTRNRTDAE